MKFTDNETIFPCQLAQKWHTIKAQTCTAHAQKPKLPVHASAACIGNHRPQAAWSKAVQLCTRIRTQTSVSYIILEKALGERRYLRQGKAIRQMASPSSLCQRFAYAHFNAVVTKISKWSRIRDSCRITSKTESLVVYAMPDIPSKFQKDPSITFRVIARTHRQINKQTKNGKNITSLAEVQSTITALRKS